MSELNSEADPQCPKDILDNLINSNNCIDLTGDEQPTGSKLFEPLFSKPDLDRKKKRKLEDFLKEFHTSSKKECIEIVSSEDEEEEDPTMSRDPEVIKALCELDFPLDKLFKKILKTHQVYNDFCACACLEVLIMYVRSRGWTLCGIVYTRRSKDVY